MVTRLLKILLINVIESCKIKLMALFVEHVRFDCGAKRMVNGESQLLNFKRRVSRQLDRNI